jgi:hypothetical protein
VAKDRWFWNFWNPDNVGQELGCKLHPTHVKTWPKPAANLR